MPRQRLHPQHQRAARRATCLAILSSALGIALISYIKQSNYDGTTFGALRSTALRASNSQTGLEQWLPLDLLKDTGPAAIPMAGAVVALGISFVAMLGSLMVLFQWFCTIRFAAGLSQNSTFFQKRVDVFLTKNWKTTFTLFAVLCIMATLISAGMHIYFERGVF